MYSTYAPTTVLEQRLIRNQQMGAQPRAHGRGRDAFRTRSLAAAVILFSVLVAQVCVRIAIIRQGYALEAVRQATMESDQRLRQYRLHYAWLTSPQRLTLKSQQELAMIPLRPQQIRKM